MKIKINQDYREFRSSSYPITGDQLDAIFKLAKSLKDSGVAIPEDTQRWINECQAVKDKFKP